MSYNRNETAAAAPTVDDGVPEHVLEIIKQIVDREGYADYEIKKSAGSNAGDGFQGNLLRLTISGQRNGRPASLSLICKVPADNLATRIEFNADVSFGREILMYGKLLPFYMEFQKEHGISESDGFSSFPKCYAAHLDEKVYGNHVLVLEDLQVSGYKMWDKMKDIDFDHVKLLMEELGKFHGLSFAIREKKPEKLIEIMNECPDKLHPLMYSSPMAKDFFINNINKAIETLEPHETELVAKLEAFKSCDASSKLIAEVFSNTTCEPFGVLIHGDLWNNNAMYKYDDASNKVVNVSLFDYQFSQFGSPALDVVHYLFCSLNYDVRAQHFHHFVELYYNSLVRTLRKFGCNDQKLFKLTDLYDQMKKFGKIVLLAGPILTQIMSVDPANIPDLDLFAQQMQDAREIGEFNPSAVDVFGNFEGMAFKNRSSNMIRDAVQEGYF